MKGFKDSSGKFHPITEYKGVRKSRDQKAKTQGIRKQRLPQQEHVIPDLRKTKSYWQVVLENPREESGTTTHIIELGKLENKDDEINALMRMQKDGHLLYFTQDLQPPYLHTTELIKTLTEDLADLNKVIPEQDLILKENMGARIYIQLLLNKLKKEDK